MNRANVVSAVTLAAGVLVTAQNTNGQEIGGDFESNYAATDLGSVPGVPTPYGGLTFKWDDPNVLLIGGAANQTGAAIYAIQVVRGCDNLITGFNGEAELFATSPRIDGGLAYGPDNVLFYTTYSNNTIGQIKPGSTEPDKIIELSTLGVTGTTGTLQFVPDGFGGAGSLKILTYSGSGWYDAGLVADGDGTFDLVNVALMSSIPSGPEGLVYVQAGSPQFDADSVLVSKYSQGRVDAYEVNADGDPILKTERQFVTGLSGAEGAAFDPVTNDFLFSTFGGGSRVIVVRGFDLPGTVGDLNSDETINVSDMLILLGQWGECPAGELCSGDFNGDCNVNVSDLLILLGNWG